MFKDILLYTGVYIISNVLPF